MDLVWGLHLLDIMIHRHADMLSRFIPSLVRPSSITPHLHLHSCTTPTCTTPMCSTYVLHRALPPYTPTCTRPHVHTQFHAMFVGGMKESTEAEIIIPVDAGWSYTAFLAMLEFLYTGAVQVGGRMGGWVDGWMGMICRFCYLSSIIFIQVLQHMHSS